MSRDNPKTLADLAAAPAAVKQKDRLVPTGAPTYKAEARLYVDGRIVELGETFQSADKPGQYWTHVSGPEWTLPAASAAGSKAV